LTKNLFTLEDYNANGVYGLLGRSIVVPAATDDTCACTADDIYFVNEVVLHKNG